MSATVPSISTETIRFRLDGRDSVPEEFGAYGVGVCEAGREIPRFLPAENPECMVMARALENIVDTKKSRKLKN